MFGLSHAAEKSTIVLLVCALILSPSATPAGDLEPSGPPAPTMRTLESLGFDCPDDAPDTTNLLFTFVTDQVGFDTGLSISNTTLDPFGTAPKTGRCTLYFYSEHAPAPFDTSDIAPGATYTTVASAIAPGFQGYLIATCSFPLAHGFALVSDAALQKVAMGYLATIVCANRQPNSMGNGR